jgi:hypothetical protein
VKDLAQSADQCLQARENDPDRRQSHLGNKILDVAFDGDKCHGILSVNHMRAFHDHDMNVDLHEARMAHPLVVSSEARGDKGARFHRERHPPFSR